MIYFVIAASVPETIANSDAGTVEGPGGMRIGITQDKGRQRTSGGSRRRRPGDHFRDLRAESISSRLWRPLAHDDPPSHGHRGSIFDRSRAGVYRDHLVGVLEVSA